MKNMAASINRHVPLCFDRYFRALLFIRRHIQHSRSVKYTGVLEHQQGPLKWRLQISRRGFSEVTSGGEQNNTDRKVGDKEGGAVNLKDKTHDNGAEKRRLLKAKKEARKQIALEKQRQKQLKKAEHTGATYDVQTPPGQKKDISIPLPKAYSPDFVEAAWYDWWHREGFFKPETLDRRNELKSDTGRFSIVLPPPNVTGTLHLGHALGNSVQDALCRWYRMSGRSVLWVPGTDHAGIATQVVVEKQLANEQGLTRHDIGREAFVEQVWKWKNEKGGVIAEQMRRLGSSLDWSREFFTLDPSHSHAVREAFIRLHDQGLIYRRERLVNWCCALKSTISDIEVESLPVEKKTYLPVPGYDKKVPFGELTSFAYPVEGSDEEIVVATTRLETMLGDTAVAVHPEDARFMHLHGRTLHHPITGRQIPLITDTAVQKDFGSGAVKITPGHDQKDYEMGRRHKLPLLNILDDSGHLINVPEQFNGLPRFDAREAVLNFLKEKNLYRGQQDNLMVLPQCSRSGDIIEPLLKDQWYVNCSDMQHKAIEAVQSGELELIPKQYESHWFEWLKDPEDWCLSRQLWWGHRVPAYRITGLKSGQTLPVGSLEWVCAHSMEEACVKAANTLGFTAEDVLLEQDADVLDTWFSSAIIPFSAMGWPEQTPDLEKFYPTDVLETGSDILFFWVARMVMMGQALTNSLPFKKVLLHGVLRDSHGRKMSKSLGNIVDPMDVIRGVTLETLQQKAESMNLSVAEVKKAQDGQRKDFPVGIEQCGTDALRFTMCAYNYKNQFVNVDVSHMAANRRFCNKIWQAFRYCSTHWDEDYTPPAQFQISSSASPTDLWVLSQLSEMVSRCQQGFESFSLFTATSAIYNFWWLRFCDIYLEYSKGVLQGEDSERADMVRDVLHLCVSTGLRALSPFMPYLTEELYQRLPGAHLHTTPTVTLAPYPHPRDYSWQNEDLDQGMVLVQGIMNQIMSFRKDFSIGKDNLSVTIVPASETTCKAVNDFAELLIVLTKLDSCVVFPPGSQVEDTTGCVRQESKDGSSVYINLAGLIDPAKELQKVSTRQTKLEEELRRLNARLTKAGTSEDTVLMLEEKIKKVSVDLERLESITNNLKSLL